MDELHIQGMELELELESELELELEAGAQQPAAKRRKSEEEEEMLMIREFIGKLRDVDVSYYVFQRHNYLKCPDPRASCFESVHPKKFAKYESMPCPPVPGMDLGRRVKHFSYDTMIQITDDFSQQNCIRRGVGGRLFTGQMPTGRDVIVRRWEFFFPLNLAYWSYAQYFSRQLELLLNPVVASNPNMAKLIGYSCDKIFALVLDLKLNRTLHDLIPDDSFKWNGRMKVAEQVASTLEIFHKNQITICYNFAPCINVDKDYNIQFFEFDHAVNLANENHSVLREMLRRDHSSYYSAEFMTTADLKEERFLKTDVYHFGLLLLELTLAKCVVVGGGGDWIECAKKDFEKGLTYSRYSRSLYRPKTMCFELAMKCLQKEPKLRPNMDEIVVELNEIVLVCPVGFA